MGTCPPRGEEGPLLCTRGPWAGVDRPPDWGLARPQADPTAAPAGPQEPPAALGPGPEEHTPLQDELSRLEGLLAQAGAEQDELAGRYHVVSERVSAQGAWQPALG